MTWISRIGFVLDLLSITSMSTSQSKGDLRGRAVCGRFRAHSKFQALGWWNGRHVRLRGVCRKACGFKSRPEHYSIRQCVAGSDNCPNPRKEVKSPILFFWRDPRICSVATDQSWSGNARLEICINAKNSGRMRDQPFLVTANVCSPRSHRAFRARAARREQSVTWPAGVLPLHHIDQV